MKKVVINRCYGGFGLSYKAVIALAERRGKSIYAFQNVQNAGHIDFERFEVYNGNGEKPFVIHYATKPLTFDGKHEPDSYYSDRDEARDDPDLVAIVEKMGTDANGDHAELSIVEIPDDVEFVIEEYDGLEWVAEQHRTWR